MLKEIFITGHQSGTAESLLRSRPHEIHGIFLCSQGHFPPQDLIDLCATSIRIEVDDVALPGNHICPNESHIVHALAFALDKPEVMSACHAGISRSSGIALLIAAKQWGIERAIGILNPGWHHPNKQIVALGSEILGMPELWSRYVHWYQQAYGFDPSANFVPHRGQKLL